MSDRTCSVSTCDRPHSSLGLCRAHVQRLRQHGDVQADKPLRQHRPMHETCTLSDCDKPHDAQGLCRMHYYRLTYRGSLDQPARPEAAASPKWIGDDAGYRAVHTRLRKMLGRAASYGCTDCHRQAEDWSYDHTDSDERHDERGCPFSTDLSRYQPRCKSCHSIFDETAFKAWRHRRVAA